MIATKNLYFAKLSDLVSLFSKSFHKDIQEDFFKWRYVNNPLGDLLASFEFDNGKLIANYSASPCLVQYNEQIIRTALSMTTMTDPDYSGGGLFTKLAQELYSHMGNIGYHLIWGFPNRYSHRGFIKYLGWFDIYEIPTMTLYLKDINPLQEDVSSDIQEDNLFLLDYTNTQRYKNLIYVVKNETYLRWRYANNPINKYRNFIIAKDKKVSSYCVVKIYSDESLDIVDLQPSNQEEAEKLIKYVIFFALSQYVMTINTWVPLHFFTHGIFEKIGFVNSAPVTYFGARILDSIQVADDMCRAFSNWYIQMGDSDVY